MVNEPLHEQSPHPNDKDFVEPNKHLANIRVWQCMNCGQNIFVIIDLEPPDTCEYCEDMTTWQNIKK